MKKPKREHYKSRKGYIKANQRYLTFKKELKRKSAMRRLCNGTD